MSLSREEIDEQLVGRSSAIESKDRTLAQLRQKTWEATQWLTYEEVQEYVASVLREVESDEP